MVAWPDERDQFLNDVGTYFAMDFGAKDSTTTHAVLCYGRCAGKMTMWLDEAEALVSAQRQIPSCPQDVGDKRRGTKKYRSGRP